MSKLPTSPAIASLLGLSERSSSRPLWQRAVTWATVGVVVLGLALRARGYLFDTHGFWFDEATWTLFLVQKKLIKLLIRPIGFMAVNKALAWAFGPSEMVMRSIPWLAGVGATIVAVPLSRRLFTSLAARLLFVAIIALHPGAIDLAKEFKPYSVSLFFHVCLPWLALRYVGSRSPRDLLLTIVTAAVGTLFSQDIVFALPGVFLVLGWESFRYQRLHLIALGAAALTIIGMLAAQYFYIWRHAVSDASDFWGDKYGVFYTPRAEESYFAWWLARVRGVAELPGLRREHWQLGTALRTPDQILWLCIHVAGLLRLVVKKQVRLLALLVLPLVMQWMFNALGMWPAGVFRTNAFLIAYTAGIAGAAAEWTQSLGLTWATLVPAGLLVVAPLVLFDRTWNARKRTFAHDSDFPELLRELVAHEHTHPMGERPMVLVHQQVCRIYDYYSYEYESWHPRLAHDLSRRVEHKCFHPDEEAKVIRATVPPNGHAWLITDMSGAEVPALRAALPEIKFRDRHHSYNPQLYELVGPRTAGE